MAAKQLYEVLEPSAEAMKAATYAKTVYIKHLRAPEDMAKWKRSSAYRDLVAYINKTSMAIQGHRLDGHYIITKQMTKLCQIFNWLEVLVMKCHPLGPGQGLLRCVGEDRINIMESTISLMHKCHEAYRHWIKLVQEKLFIILERQVHPHCKHINELAQYLTRSFGSIRHYDYGPGNELMFVFFLCGLFKSGILQGEDTIASALLLYPRYLELARRLVSFYRLSSDRDRDNNSNHICNIDKHNVLPYIWGCAQLCRDAPFEPSQWEDAGLMEEHHKSYMLMGSLKHLQKIMDIEGDGSALGVHSFQLWCVLAMSKWSDAYAAMMTSYTRNILNDFYTAQDLIFCEMMSIVRQPLERLEPAYMGDIRPADTTSSFSLTSKQVGDELELEEEHKIMRTIPTYAAQLDDDDGEIESPLSRYQSLETNVLLGFYDPLNPSDDNETENEVDDRSRLRQKRICQDEDDAARSATVPFRSASQTFQTDESGNDMSQIKEQLGIQKDTSKLDSTPSFFSI